MAFKRSRIVRDISDFVERLEKHDFDKIIELHHLKNITGRHKTPDLYNIDYMVFNISTSGLNCDPIVKKVTVAIELKYELESNLTEKIDLFKSYSFQLLINGYIESGDVSNLFCWHLDKECHTNGKFAHPLYHFHAGGNRIDGYEKGNLLMISSPRIPHPPMDVILAIHFVIQNFVNAKDFPQKKLLLQDPEYINIIERAQTRVLDPYFHAFSGKEHNIYTPQNLFPLYI